MATPLDTVHKALVAALKASGELSGVQVFDRYPDELAVPRLQVFAYRQAARQIALNKGTTTKPGLAWTYRADCEIICERADTRWDARQIHEAVDTELDTALSVSGYTVTAQYSESFDADEVEDEETGASMEIAVMTVRIDLQAT